jgi:hypothetical protein
MRRRSVAGASARAALAALALMPASAGLTQTVAQTAAPAASSLSPRHAREIARDAYVYAYPAVLMEIARRVMTNVERPEGLRSPMNQIAHARAFPDAAFTDLPRPAADTLLSRMHLDVSKEPMIVSLPDAGGRYYLLSLVDQWSEVFASRGRRTGTGAQTFAVVGPRWQGRLPSGVSAIRSPTAVAVLTGRIQVEGKGDLAAAHKFQGAIKAVPLGQYGRVHRPPKGRIDPQQDMSAPVEQVERMDAGAFFALFAEAMKENPPHPGDSPMLARLKRIGIEPGRAFALSAAPAEVRHALAAAPAEALKMIEAAFARSGTPANGWRTHLMAMGTYGTDYLQRAAMAYAGLGAATPDDTVFATAFADGNGQPLSGEAGYVLHFGKDQLPPVRALWSLTLYDVARRLASNPTRRHVIGARDKLWFNDDGSLDLHIGPESPGSDKAANWLPAPGGPFTLTLRLDWPKPEVLKGTWVPPPLRPRDESVGSRALR